MEVDSSLKGTTVEAFQQVMGEDMVEDTEDSKLDMVVATVVDL